MEVAGGWKSQMLLLLFLCLAALQEPLEEKEECIVEGQNITFGCGYNFGKYFRAIKAWQRLGASGPFETLAQTMNNNGEPSFIQVGRYLLEDDPPNSMLKVTILELQREDAGLYQCVIYRPPQVVDILYRPIRLKTCNEFPVYALILVCGLLLFKIVVFSLLLLLLRKARVTGDVAPLTPSFHPEDNGKQ
uniref:Triggering receptor expressed on myeloid cells 1-like n=1 Tax=Monodelphis domestica TaxID=13616 RepID=K7E2D4_MONDO